MLFLARVWMLASICSLAFAQVSVAGRVTNENDLLAPGALVTVEDIPLSKTWEAISDPTGAFLLQLPSTGQYSFKVDREGLQTKNRDADAASPFGTSATPASTRCRKSRSIYPAATRKSSSTDGISAISARPEFTTQLMPTWATEAGAAAGRPSEAPLPHFIETFMDNGYYDMYKIMKALCDVNFDGIVIPDRTPSLQGGSNAQTAYGFAHMKALLNRANAKTKT
jgi:hypothetical protein